ncbi:MAG: RDD family protein [bacterium]|nr:RDD family protein [bacterium]
MPNLDARNAEDTQWREAADVAYLERIGQNTLSELEDIYAHLDRETYPKRFEMVYNEIERRLRELDAGSLSAPAEDLVAASFLRRLWASLVDLFVHLLIPGGAAWGLMTLVGGGQASAPGPRRGPSPLARFYDALLQGDLAAWETVGVWVVGVLLFKAVLTLPAWVRSGCTPGMREVGVRLVSAQGDSVSFKQALLRFLGQYALFFLTLGVSSLWMLWDRQKRTLHDRLAGTRVVRTQRVWEKTAAERKYE